MTETHSPRPPGSPLAWFLVLLAGQGASLALSSAGRTVAYQHYRLDALLAPGWGSVWVGVLLLQALAVTWGMRRQWGGVWSWLRRTVPTPLLVAAPGVLLILAAAPSRHPREYVAELLFAFVVQLLAVGAAFLAARTIDDRDVPGLERRLTTWLGSADPAPRRFLDPVAVVTAVAVTIACVFLAVVVYERTPHLPDEIVYLIHARYFAAGALALPAPPVQGAFDVDLLYYDTDRTFSPVPPGWPALLALGVRAGTPWLVNPLLSGLSILLFHAVVRHLDTPRTARLATLLLATSPWFLFLGMSLMTHTATLACALAAAWGVAEARARGTLLPAALAGVATGMAGLIRPLEGLVVALVVGCWSLGARHRRFRLLPSAVLTGVTVGVSLLTRPYNARLTGAPDRFPIMMYIDRYYGPGANDLGFGPNRGMGWGGLDPFPGHGWPDVIVNSLLNGSAINIELFAWATGSLVAVVVLIASRRLRRADWALLGIVALVAGVHALYWFSGGPDFGARYWYLVIAPLVILTARAPSALFGEGTPNATRASVTVLALTAGALVAFVPWRSVEKYYHYRGMSPAVQRLTRAHEFGTSLVLVRGGRHPDYHMAALENPLDLRAEGPIFAWDRSRPIRADVVRAYGDRPVYVVDGPSLTGGPFRIVAGPLPPGSLAPDLPSSDELLADDRRPLPGTTDGR